MLQLFEVVVPNKTLPLLSVTVAPLSAVPVNVGVLSLVTESPVIVGLVVLLSTVIITAGLVCTFPSLSVELKVIVFSPSSNPVNVIDHEPSVWLATVVKQLLLVTILTVEPGDAVPVTVGEFVFVKDCL